MNRQAEETAELLDDWCIRLHPSGKIVDMMTGEVIDPGRKPEPEPTVELKRRRPRKPAKMGLIVRARQRLAGEFQQFNAWLQHGGSRPITPVLSVMLRRAMEDRASRKNITRWARLRFRYGGAWIRVHYRIDTNGKIWLVPPRHKLSLVEICEDSMQGGGVEISTGPKILDRQPGTFLFGQN